MRNREAAKYARWSIGAAAAIALVVAGVYAERAYQAARARRLAPKPVPATVERQSAEFMYSKVEQDRTVFTIRASRATQFRAQDRALLEDVWITIYGRDGSRNDNIHTRECNYEPVSGVARCQGDVEINVEDAQPAAGQAAAKTLELKTSDISFNRETGEASTPSPVEFHFAAGSGRGVGVAYSTRDAIVRVEHGVEFDLSASVRTGGVPVTVAGSSLEVRTKDRSVVLHGPATVRQSGLQLTSEAIRIELDASSRVRRAVAEGHPQIRATEGTGKLAVSAARLEGSLNPAGWVERVTADGGIIGTRETAAGSDRFSAARVEFAMRPKTNLVEQMTASGGVAAESQRPSGTQTLKTDALRGTFANASAARMQAAEQASGQPASETFGGQRVENVETLAPATIELKGANDATTIEAKKLVAQIGADGRVEELLGHSGVEIRRQTASGAPQSIASEELAATFGAKGEWDTVEESGNVRFQQADRQASAAHARIVRATDSIVLGGSPVISDAMTRTTAASVAINQKSGEVRASGSLPDGRSGVVTTYLPASRGDVMSLGYGPAHISADSLTGSATSGHVAYTGHARLWQGDAVLDADQIELWRDDKKLQATGHVVAVFPQAAGTVVPVAAPSAKSSGATQKQTAGPTLWTVRAPVLTYFGDQGKAHLDGGVTASSAQGSLESRSLDLFLAPPETPGGAAPPSATKGSAAQQLSKVLARGNVVVQQGTRRGMADQAEYTAADGKFVLSGGQPSVTDGLSNTATGHSLTFYIASDTILVDSQEGSRTLTKHRVEK